ncbi:MAG: hypothetical protein WDO16_18700 [Bacteroidota bacterium]
MKKIVILLLAPVFLLGACKSKKKEKPESEKFFLFSLFLKARWRI